MLLLVFVCVSVLGPDSVAAARRCHSIYKGFAQCLMALGDSLTDNARRDEDTNEIHSICRSVCAYKHMLRHIFYIHKVALLSEGVRAACLNLYDPCLTCPESSHVF